MYLTYNEYSKLGGKADANVFPALERKARHKLDYFTQDRIKSLPQISEEIKECIAEYVDLILEESSGEKVASFSNGSVSVSFANNEKSLDESLYRIAVEYLPLELVTMAVN